MEPFTYFSKYLISIKLKSSLMLQLEVIRTNYILVLCQCSVIDTTGVVPSVKCDILYCMYVCMYMLTLSCNIQNVNDKVLWDLHANWWLFRWML